MKYWIVIAMLCLTACRPEPVNLETYYFKIKDIHLRIPGKYFSFFRTGITLDPDRSCRKKSEECAQHPPGLGISGIVFREQDFYTFARYDTPKDFQGLSDAVEIHVDDPNDKNIKKLPNFSDAWNPSNRDKKNDNYGLSAYKKFNLDDINYRYDLGDGEVLYMTCQAFTMPNPGCEVATTWRGLLLRYAFRHRHLAEWRNLHQRLVAHLDSFVYQP